ncbi:MAG TPA: ABC transporter transmembrane domain-containing protein, partial [Ilumatobacteraceae bacterium]
MGIGRRRDAQRARPGSGWPILRALLRQQRAGLAMGTIIGLAWSAGKVAVPKLTRLAIDNGINGNESLLRWSVFIATAGVLAGVFTALRRWYAFRESRSTEMVIREQLFEHIQRLHIAYHDRTQTGQLMSRASSDLLQIQAFVVMIPITASNLAMVAAVVVLLAVSQPWLALIALAPLPLLNVLSVRFSRRI